MNIVFCVCRSWNIEILEGLIRIQKTKRWKVNFIIAPTGTEISQIDEMKISYIQPTQLEKYSDTIKSKKPQVIICYGWSWKIPESILKIAPCLILHPSPLPRYRGGSPIQNQLLDGVKESAVTIFYATGRLDSGDILAQEPISFEGYLQDIVERISEVGLRLTIDLLDRMVKGPVQGRRQDESQSTVVKRRTPSMSEITIEDITTNSAEYLYNKIRGLQTPYPEAFIVCGDGKKLFIKRSHLED